MIKNRLLGRLLKRRGLSFESAPKSNADWQAFLTVIQKTFEEFDEHRLFNENLIATATKEMSLLYDALDEKKRRKDAEMQKIMDALPSMIAHWGSDQICLHANQAHKLFFGKEPQDIIGRSVLDLMGPAEYEKTLPYINKVLSGEPVSFERDLVGVNGETRCTHVNYLPEVRNGKVESFFVIAADVTELKNHERERQIIEAQLVSSSKLSALGEMAGGVAHEINNPLAIIKMKTEHLYRQVEDGTLDKNIIAQGLIKISNTVERIAAIIRGLRTISRNAEDDPKVMTDVATMVSEVIVLCKERFKHGNIEFRYRNEFLIDLECRPVQIMQVLMNLLNNAYDALETLPEKWIELDVREKSGRVEFVMTDSGAGIPPAVLEKLMQPFFTTKEPGRGTGLGLSISRGIALDHGGTLTYDKSCANTRFILSLPLANGASAAA